jgi:hypothetical protein
MVFALNGIAVGVLQVRTSIIAACCASNCICLPSFCVRVWNEKEG